VKPQHVELHIEELVLHGLPHGDQHRVGATVESELARLFTTQGTPPQLARGHEIERLNGGQFEMEPNPGAETIGARIARAVYGGLLG
jgi:hypothetical protein